MKTLKEILTIICSLFLLLTLTSSSAFNENTWQGDTAGRYNDWFTASNWSNNKVPDEFNHVIIPNLNSQGGHYPILKDEVIIQSLELHKMAEITIAEKGNITIISNDRKSFAISY